MTAFTKVRAWKGYCLGNNFQLIYQQLCNLYFTDLSHFAIKFEDGICCPYSNASDITIYIISSSAFEKKNVDTGAIAYNEYYLIFHCFAIFDTL